METLEAARITFNAKSADHMGAMSDMLTKSWRFAWLLKRRERPVADWAWGMLFQTIGDAQGTSQLKRDAAMLQMFASIMSGLNDWRTGAKKITWFRDDLVRIQSSKTRLAETPPQIKS